MHLRLVSAVLALLGGVVLLVAGVLALVAGGDSAGSDWHQTVAVVGYALALLSLAVLGYSLVATAPIWLGAIVAVCTPLLVASVWQALAPELADRMSDGEAVVWLVGGVLALVLGYLENRSRPAEDLSDRQLR
jgi:hypothetical membrane protein